MLHTYVGWRAVYVWIEWIRSAGPQRHSLHHISHQSVWADGLHCHPGGLWKVRERGREGELVENATYNWWTHAYTYELNTVTLAAHEHAPRKLTVNVVKPLKFFAKPLVLACNTVVGWKCKTIICERLLFSVTRLYIVPPFPPGATLLLWSSPLGRCTALVWGPADSWGRGLWETWPRPLWSGASGSARRLWLGRWWM